ncbi:MAG: GNAT family N-acetyltransferase [Paracoccaceae bacterium]
MNRPTIRDIYAICEATWPPATSRAEGPWTIREGQGGGKRVSAATLAGEFDAATIARAERAMADIGQPSLFMIRDGEDALDAALAGRGYDIVDPVVAYLAPVGGLAGQEVPPMTTFPIWQPLAVMKEVWAGGGIGPERLAVMDRVAGPKTAIMGRRNDRVSGCAFVAIHEKTAMLHALEVVPEQRRQKSAVYMLRSAARWAQDQGADWMSLVVTEANGPARALYASLGMTIVGHYHYRLKARKRGQSS